uniref:RING-type domain-containing protein n=1 Tax=viral metagenome TaxID=1070528 RepID=A0A6C0J0M9_9ZZZZ
MDELYDIELDDNSTRANQPQKITTLLKPHQLACLNKAINMENNGIVKYKISENNPLNINYRNVEMMSSDNIIDVSTNVGIIGDIVGYGKTLTALSIIAQNPVENIHINTIKTTSIYSSRVYSYFTSKSMNLSMIDDYELVQSTLVIVPRGPVYIQWIKTLENNTSLKFIALDNFCHIKKYLPPHGTSKKDIITFFNKYDVILIKNTTLDLLINYYDNHNNEEKFILNKWKRVMIDESHDIIQKIQSLHYSFMWLISATYTSLAHKSTGYCNMLLFPIREFLREENINLMLLKCKKDFVRKSFSIPALIEKYYHCNLSKHLNIIKNYINPSILEKINANDISGAVKELGGKNESEQGLIDVVCSDIKRDLNNKIKEYDYISDLDISPENKVIRLKNITNDINTIKNKLTDLTERISELSSKSCSICLDNISDPIVLECTHVYCGKCLMTLLNVKTNTDYRCPECRALINPDKLIAIVSNDKITKEAENVIIPKKVYNKQEMLINIINNKPNGKFLVFSRVDNGFASIIENLNKNNITYAELKGHTGHMMKVLESFKKGALKVILLNTFYAGSGIDINFATDVIIFHSMGIDKQQAIGRAQRVGRNDELVVHNLCYEHELPTNVSIEDVI